MQNKIIKETKIKIKSGTIFHGTIISETKTDIIFRGTGWLGEDNTVTIAKSYIVQIDDKPYLLQSHSSQKLSLPFFILTEAFEGTGRTVLSFDIIFKEDLTSAMKHVIEEKLPQPFKRHTNWISDSFFHFSTQEWYDMNIRIAYNKKIAGYFNKHGIDLFDENRYNIFFENSFDDTATEKERSDFDKDVMMFLTFSNSIIPIVLVYTTDIINHPKFKRYLRESIPHFSDKGLIHLLDIWNKAPNRNGDQIMDVVNLTFDVLSAYVREIRKINPADAENLLQLIYSINKISEDESWEILINDIKGKVY